MPIIIGSFYFYGDDDMLRSVEHHRQIIAALRARDAECAALAVRFHLAATHLLFRNHRKGKGPAGGGMTRPPAHETGSRCSCPHRMSKPPRARRGASWLGAPRGSWTRSRPRTSR